MALLNFKRKPVDLVETSPELERFLQGYSIEVMPRTAEKIENFQDILPKGTRVYIAHIEGTPIEDMVKTAARLASEGYAVMPHFPARIIKDKATLENWIDMYQAEAGVNQALLLAGGVTTPHGDFDSSMQLLETGLFDAKGFTRLHVAGHPEGNKTLILTGHAKMSMPPCRGNNISLNVPMQKWPLPRNLRLRQVLSLTGQMGLRRQALIFPFILGSLGRQSFRH